MHLALDDHRVHDIAEIVDGHEALDLGRAGRRVDLELADVGAGRVGEVGRIEERRLLHARLHQPLRDVVRDVGLEDDLADALHPVGADDRELAVLELDVAFRSLEQVGRDLLALGDQLVGSLARASPPTASEREP